MKMNEKGKYILVVCPNPAIDILASISSFEKGIPNRISKEVRYPGGKGIHVAMALSEMGIDVVVAGFWGSVTGEWIKNECNKYYPTIKFAGPLLHSWSRSCYTFQGTEDVDDTEVLGAGPEVSTKDINDLYQKIEPLLDNCRAVALSGSWPKGAPDNAYKLLVELANEKEIPTFLDCTGPQLTHALEVEPFCVHLNRREVSEHFKCDFDQATNELLKFCFTSAITDGSKGLYLSTAMETAHSLVEIDHVISTVGSGDCLLAGIIAGYHFGYPFEDIARLGAACGAANCVRPELGMLSRREVEKLMGQFLAPF